MEADRLPRASTRAWILVLVHTGLFPGDDAVRRGARGIGGTASRGDAVIPLQSGDRSTSRQSLS